MSYCLRLCDSVCHHIIRTSTDAIRTHERGTDKEKENTYITFGYKQTRLTEHPPNIISRLANLLETILVDSSIKGNERLKSVTKSSEDQR